jgi:hypothetical protein
MPLVQGAKSKSRIMECSAVTQPWPWIRLVKSDYPPTRTALTRPVTHYYGFVGSRTYRQRNRIIRRDSCRSGSARLGLSQKGDLPSPARTEHYGPRSPTRALDTYSLAIWKRPGTT